MVCSLYSNAQVVSQKVGVNPTNINPSAVYEVESSTKGFLPPRMTADLRDAVVTPDLGLTIWCTNCGANGELNIFNGKMWITSAGTAPAALSWYPVTSLTGRVWMDRNLGATQVAVSAIDAAAYGDLYQWGRLKDGHQIRTSSTSTVASTGDIPGHSNFITISTAPIDWRSPQNNSLWQGATGGVNNPCPSGYRIPTNAEWTTEGW